MRLESRHPSLETAKVGFDGGWIGLDWVGLVGWLSSVTDHVGAIGEKGVGFADDSEGFEGIKECFYRYVFS